MKKLAIVVQRFGLEVNGGAEFHARILAEKLSETYNVKVLTTTALDYVEGWKNHYPEGECLVNGVKTIRFQTDSQFFTKKKLRKIGRAIFKRKKYFRILKFIKVFDFLDKKYEIFNPNGKDILDWFITQGPYCPKMLEYISANRDSFDGFIFFTYLYYPTVLGMKIVPEKSIFIPTAHDEEILFTKAYEDIFSVPKFIMYNTESEKKLVESRFEKVCQNSDIAGVGIEEFSLPENYRTNESIDYQYFIYIGRLCGNKGYQQMVNYFNKFSESYPSVKLVIVGQNLENIQPTENLILTGFVTEEEKYYLLQKSLGLIMPSKYESLSMVVLEAMMSGKEVVVNSECDVLKQHVLQSKTGFCYTGYDSFSQSLEAILFMNDDILKERAKMAKAYVRKNYDWDAVLEKFDKAIDFVSK